MKLDEFAQLSPDERRRFFVIAAERLHLPSVAVVEKDFWVCWVLQKFFLFDSEFGPFTFKGGTSLSKCYSLIDRFSEDIDIGIERKTLGYSDDRFFYEAPSKTQRLRRVEEQQVKACAWLHDQIAPRLRAIASEVLGNGWEIYLDEDIPERLYFRYVPIAETSQYVQPEVIIEFGTLDAWPTERVTVGPYIGELPELKDLEHVDVRVLDPVRTFWEKAVILHRFAHLADGKSFPVGKSRHYYDVLMLARSAWGARLFDRVDLLEAVARYKDTFYAAGYARYDRAADPRTLVLCPPEHVRRAVEVDYEVVLSAMAFPESTPPPFDELESELKVLEVRINNSPMLKPGVFAANATGGQ